MKSFEQFPPQEPKKPFYRERSLEAMRASVQELAKLENEQEKTPLELEEREMLLGAEQRLGSLLEKILYEQSAPLFTVASEYLLTEEGKRDAAEVFGLKFEALNENNNPGKELFKERGAIQKSSSKQRVDFSARSQRYREEALFSALQEVIKVGKPFIEAELPPMSNISILMKPEVNRQRLRNLRRLKNFLKKQYAEESAPELSEVGKAAWRELVNIYTVRVNEAIASQLETVSQAGSTAENLSAELLPTEQVLFSDDDIRGKAKNLGRLDKFTHGAAKEKISNTYTPLSEDLKEYARFIAEKRKKSHSENRAFYEEHEIDKQKLESLLVEPEEIEKLSCELLAHYNLLSSFPIETYEPERTTPAPDNKWQVHISDRYRSMSVNGVQKVVKIPKKAQSVETLLTITLAHEIEGHVLQRENRELLPFQLFNRLGSGRSSLFAECGAMHNQKEVSENIFGKQNFPHPHYTAAIEKRLQGGNLLATIEAFYQSQQGDQFSDEKITSDQQEKALRLAINRSLRIFRNGENFTSVEAQVENSKDLVYLEQEAFYQELARGGVAEYAYLSGVNFQSLQFLQKFGFIESKKVRTPDFYTQEIWGKLKERYQK